jgi:predicted RNA binding protein YcfA (HicA-like mRNA interferase family)
LSKKEKLFLRLRTIPSDFSFQELETILKQFGFKRKKTNAGSHFKWFHEDKNITYAAPRKNPMKKIYLKELVNILETHF